MKQYFSFQWHITDACDQRCKHCYIFSENNCKELDSMTWPQMQETFANCLDFCETYGRLPYFLSPAATRSCTRISGNCSACSKTTASRSQSWVTRSTLTI